MDCRKAKNLIPYAADNALDSTRQAQLDAHLLHCPACAAAFAEAVTAIESLSGSLRSAVDAFHLPADFAAAVASQVEPHEVAPQGIVGSFGNRLSAYLTSLASNKRVAAVGATAALAIAVTIVGIGAGKALDATPVPAVRVNTGHLIAFTVKPGPNGRVVTDIDAHRYCKISRDRQEALP